jgi:hypothetical protein
MAKEVKPRERAYFRNAKFEFNGKWTVNDNSIDSVINNAITFFNTNRKLDDKDAYSYWNVKYSIKQLHICETMLSQDIIQSWLDMFHDYVASAIYLDAYHGTPGNEKPKFKAAELVLAEFQKKFA